MSVKNKSLQSSLSQNVLKEITDSLNTLDYGSIVIKVHDKRVVQIEVTKRKRYDDMENFEKGAGI
ncbi:MAG: YezD family protein [Phycisphaerae bacterium]